RLVWSSLILPGFPDLFEHLLDERDRVIGGEDGSPDDEVIGAGTYGVGRGGDTRLIPREVAGWSDAGGDDEEVGAVASFEGFGFDGRGDDAIEPGVGGYAREPGDLVPNRAELLVPDLLDVGGVEGGEEGDAEDPGSGALGD